ncbi:hypothetical protein CALCODRAFT_503868 [Calocera cornea HHB12733]|uniref:Uncharacterized protein n=1 Tax=Calocera cornea HHB12733 TaxID=1353952 RepID=A0A165CPZ4_9BASI|nr:hypothetical protein CALCODRAFT_503868 [Calocera cornea HHB12733]
MDELINSCLREIAFDGDYGCDASRLKSFIEKFYAGNSKIQQNVDDGFRALVWSYIVQHPSVRVGFRPPNVKQDVFIADDVEKARGKGVQRQKYVNKGNKLAEEEGAALPRLVCLDREEIENSTLDELLQKRGTELRIAVAPELCFQAITGSSLTPARLTPLTYTVLQLVARAREKGITFVELSRITGYGAGSVFYLIKQLEIAGLVKKVATVARSGTQMAVHTHFWFNHPDWQGIRAEETHETVIPSNIDRSGQAGVVADNTPAQEEDDDLVEAGSLHFDLMDDRHLSSPDIILGRIIKLLEHSKNNCHRQIDMLTRLGLPRPTKTQRRRFSNIVDAAVAAGILERLFLPSSRQTNRNHSLARVLRLLSKPVRSAQLLMTANTSGEAEANADADEKEVEAHGKALLTGTQYLATLTLQRNLTELVHASGTDGITLQGILRELGLCEMRTYEHQLQKMSRKTQLLPHISDMNIVLLFENVGRERRLRVYTARSFALLLEQEKLDDPEEDHIREDTLHSGGFCLHRPEDFYADKAELERFVNAYEPKRLKTDPKVKRRTWRLGYGEAKKYTNPIGPDGKPIKGRPRKYPPGESKISLERKRRKEEKLRKAEEKKRQLEEAAAAGSGRPTKRARLSERERSHKESDTAGPAQNVVERMLQDQDPSAGAIKEPKKRGRKPKLQVHVSASLRDEQTAAVVLSSGSNLQNKDDAVAHMTNPGIPLPAGGGLFGGVLASRQRTSTKRQRMEDEASGEPPSKRAIPPGMSSTMEMNEEQHRSTPLEDDPADTGTGVIKDAEDTRPLLQDAISAPDQVASLTRQDVALLASDDYGFERPRRKHSIPFPKKANISYSRRAQEIVEVLKRHDGVLHAGQPFLKAHREYVRELEVSGVRPAGSATLMDKRTLQITIDLLLRNKEIKVLVTDSGAYGQTNRALYILYLPETQVEVLERYRRSLEQQLPIYYMQPIRRQTEGPSEYSEVKRKKRQQAKRRALREQPAYVDRVVSEKKIGYEHNLRRARLLDESESAKFLAAKARQTKQVLDKSWEALVAQTIETLVPGTFDINAPELLEVKKNWYLRGGGMNIDNARDRIISAITGTAMPAIKKMARRYYQPSRQGPPQDVPHCSLCEQHLEVIKKLVTQQEVQHQALLLQQQATATGKRPRHSRYTWTPDYDELALDAEAVIRARCGPDGVPAVSLFAQIFPRLTANSVRTHLAKLREARPGGTAYFTQLQAAWNALRLQPHADVPDPFPESLTHFPLERHIAYLRAHLDKSKLGIPQAADAFPTEDELLFILPDNPSYIEAHWDVASAKDPVTEWDFIWTSATDELRGRNVHHESFTLPSVTDSSTLTSVDLSLNRRAEAAVKMTVAPSEEDYDSARATEMLHFIGQQHVATAFSDLRHAGVIKALDRKPPSGRAMGISEFQLDALDGLINWKLFRDADLLERDLMHVELEPWSVMASDGRTAGLLDLISDDRVELTIDISACTALDIEMGISSRKINDENLENNIYVSPRDDSLALAALASSSTVTTEAIAAPASAGHTGDDIRCFVPRGGLTNCASCIDGAFQDYVLGLSDPEKEEVCQLRRAIVESGQNGLLVPELEHLCHKLSVSFAILQQRIWEMVSAPIPILTCVGYDKGRIISTTFLQEWCLQTSSRPFDMVEPRRWMQPTGRRDDAIWQMSLRNVMGWIIARPGLSEAALRERCKALFDRLEMNDLLRFLSKEGFAARKTADGGTTPALIGFSTDKEEVAWHWHTGRVPWYRVH